MNVFERVTAEQLSRLQHVNRSKHWRRVSFELACKVGCMFLRGAILKSLSAESKAIPLVGRGAKIRNAEFIHFGEQNVVEDLAEIQGLSADGIRFGNSVSVGPSSMIRPSSYYSRELGVGLSVGDRSSIGPQCYIGCSGGIQIGSDVMLGPGVRLFSENHKFEPGLTIKSQGVERGQIVIEDDCWIASGVTVTAGVTIGRGSVVAAGAVVTKSLPAFSIAAGVPARVIGSRSQ